ncbi:hypothetical protein BJ122_11163 [Rhodopseudomonas faecalis]|uniref:Uncharacterized protein n=1 Tax=Rhodopseudomonas faecalis TaxID=99655 RepID=A0A318TDB2_9BRAD|nr:hypothetical protein BJ122_11163 [Rhodopseudomonas faecalis]
MAGIAGRVGGLCFPFTTSVEHHTTIVTTLLDFVVLAVTALIALRTPTRPGFASLRRATLPTRGREKRALLNKLAPAAGKHRRLAGQQ